MSTIDQVTASGEPPMRVREGSPYSPSSRSPSSRSPSSVRKSNLEYDSDDEMIDWRPNDYRDSEFNDEAGPPGSHFIDYESSRRDEGRPSLAYRPHHSKVPSVHASHDPAIHPPRPLPSSVARIRQEQRKRTFNDRPLSPSQHFHFNDPRYPRMNQEDEVEPYDVYPSHPDRYSPVRGRRQRAPVSEWLLPKDDPNIIRQSEGIYDSGIYDSVIVAGKCHANLRKLTLYCHQ